VAKKGSGTPHRKGRTWRKPEVSEIWGVGKGTSGGYIRVKWGKKGGSRTWDSRRRVESEGRKKRNDHDELQGATEGKAEPDKMRREKKATRGG